MHPNWRALATCIIRQQDFVTSKTDECIERCDSSSIDLNSLIKTNQSGEEVSKIYESIINSPSTSQITLPHRPKIEIVNKYNSPVIYTFNNFCQATTSGNIKLLKSALESNPDFLNQSDQYDWTPLMMAACDGVAESFHYLLDCGADPFWSNKTGQSSYFLAKKKGHYNILNIIFNYANEKLVSTKPKTQISPFFCELCGENFKESTKEKHQTSILHQFNLKHHNFPTRFGICESNRGFQLMLKQGWDRNSGLGPGQQGHLFPIKTQMRNFRTGLGVEQKRESRITHFKANDVSAIKLRIKPKPYRRRDRERDIARDIRKDRILRNELS